MSLAKTIGMPFEILLSLSSSFAMTSLLKERFLVSSVRLLAMSASVLSLLLDLSI